MDNDIVDFSITYKRMRTSRRKPGSYEQAKSSLSDCATRNDWELSILNKNQCEAFEFLKSHRKTYLVNPCFLKKVPSIDGVESDDVLVENVMPYEAWLDKLCRGTLNPNPKSKKKTLVGEERWKTVKKHMDGFFRELMQSLLKAHEDGFKIHPKSEIFLCVEFGEDSNCYVKKCKFTFLDSLNGEPFDPDLRWFWNEVKRFLEKVNCWNLAPASFIEFVSNPVFQFATGVANDCPYFWTHLRKADFIFEFAKCICEGRFDRQGLSGIMDRYDLASWVNKLQGADQIKFGRLQQLLVEPRFGIRLGMGLQDRRIFINQNIAQYNIASDLVVFYRDALTHYCDYERTRPRFVKSREEKVKLMEDLFDGLFFKLWRVLGDYISQIGDPDRGEIEQILFETGWH